MTDIKKALDENIPREAISTRSQAGKALSYLEGWYVIDRLNQILGTENWSHNVVNLSAMPDQETPTFIAHVRIIAEINGKQVVKDGIGYGVGKGNFNPYEMATKEAETDGLKRAAMKLGRSLGLALYDKEQQYVGETATANQSTTEDSNGTAKRSDASTVGSVPSQAKSNTETKAPTKDRIKAAYAVLKAKGKVTADDFSSKYLNGKRVDALTDKQADTALTSIQKDFPEIRAS